VFYRADRIGRPATKLPCTAIAPEDGWCDAPADPAYNRKIRLPYKASAETLWRDDTLYDIVVVLGHNDDPVVPGAGSAIFLHLARDDGGPTEGCIGVARPLALALVAALDVNDRICIATR
jgi:L,D-peptidoglycan transpeptidase YkuD (ErfK/YbiS/YcfS/YnhG family)